MKVRTDYVTNSSSSSFICLKVDSNTQELILLANGITKEKLSDVYEVGNDQISLKGDLVVDICECADVNYVGYPIYESDLQDHTLTDLRKKVVENIKTEYNIELRPDELTFDYGEVYR